MTDDIVSRLRGEADASEELDATDSSVAVMLEAADQIERLKLAILKAGMCTRPMPEAWAEIPPGQIWSVAYGFGLGDATRTMLDALVENEARETG